MIVLCRIMMSRADRISVPGRLLQVSGPQTSVQRTNTVTQAMWQCLTQIAQFLKLLNRTTQDGQLLCFQTRSNCFSLATILIYVFTSAQQGSEKNLKAWEWRNIPPGASDLVALTPPVELVASERKESKNEVCSMGSAGLCNPRSLSPKQPWCSIPCVALNLPVLSFPGSRVFPENDPVVAIKKEMGSRGSVPCHHQVGRE